MNKQGVTVKKRQVFLLVLMGFGKSLFSEFINWDNTEGGVWGLNTNWIPTTIPNNSADTAVFGNLLAGPLSISVDGDTQSELYFLIVHPFIH